MSTRQRLDPQVRIDRQWRRATARRLHNAAAILFNSGKVSEGAVVQLLANWAQRTKGMSHRTGASKQASFIQRIPQEI